MPNADYLSRLPADINYIAIASKGQCNEVWEWPDPNNIAEIQKTMKKIETYVATRLELTINNVIPAEKSLDSLDGLTSRFDRAKRLKAWQSKDKDCQILRSMITGNHISGNCSPQLKRLQKTAESCMLKDDLLYHRHG